MQSLSLSALSALIGFSSSFAPEVFRAACGLRPAVASGVELGLNSRTLLLGLRVILSVWGRAAGSRVGRATTSGQQRKFIADDCSASGAFLLTGASRLRARRQTSEPNIFLIFGDELFYAHNFRVHDLLDSLRGEEETLSIRVSQDG